MDWKYKDITERIIGAAMKVHTTLGNGFPEVIYQRALALQLQTDNVEFIQECNMPVFYLQQKIGDRRVDLLVEQKICVELKAITNLDTVHFAQARNYLEAFNLEIALLINFGSTSLQYRRLSNPRYNPAIFNHNNL
jgi:GxxExxY protein